MAWKGSGVRFPSAPPLSKCLRAAGAYQVGAVDRRVAHDGARVGRLDHLAAAHVDAAVVDGRSVEDEVAGLQLGDGDVGYGAVLHLSVVGQTDAPCAPGIH